MSKADISIKPYGHTWKSRRKKRTFINATERMACTHKKQMKLYFMGVISIIRTR